MAKNDVLRQQIVNNTNRPGREAQPSGATCSGETAVLRLRDADSVFHEKRGIFWLV